MQQNWKVTTCSIGVASFARGLRTRLALESSFVENHWYSTFLSKSLHTLPHSVQHTGESQAEMVEIY